MRSGIVFIVFAFACVFVGTAGASPTRDYVATVGEGTLVEPAGLAVDDGTGNLYIADPGKGAVLRFGPTGAPAPFAATAEAELPVAALPKNAAQVAVDNSTGASKGRFYVANGASVEAFTRTGEPSNFTPGGEFTAENRIVGNPYGEFGQVSGVAVDPAGNIYVADQTTGAIAVYRPDGEYVTLANYNGIVGLGAGETGRVYMVETNGTVRRIQFDLTEGSYSEQLLPKTIPAKTGVTVDPTTRQMLLAGAGEVAEYDAPASGPEAPEESLRFTFGSDQLHGGAIGLAVDRSTKTTAGSAYVSTGDRVVRFGAVFNAPTPVTEPASAVDSTARTATLNGTVNPEGKVVTACEFEYGNTYEGTFEYARSVACVPAAGKIGAGSAPVAVHAEVSDLGVGNYHFRLSASNSGGYLKGADRSFAILGTPTVEAESAAPSRTEALLSGTIGPENGRTTYSFEYGPTAAYGQSSATSTIPAGTAKVRVSLPIVQLTPGTTYHYRLVADNGYRTTVGADATFTTAPAGGAAGCPNEALRIGPSGALGECRAYEMVSPPDKNGGSVYLLSNNPAAPSGEAIEFTSTATFAGGPAASTSSYVSRRGAEGWTTEAVDVAQLNRSSLAFSASPASSEDLGTSLDASLRALAPGAVEGQFNLYLRDNLTGALTTAFTYPAEIPYFQFTVGSPILAVAPDFSHVYFDSQSSLLPGAVPPGGGVSIYDVDHGHLVVVSRVPNLAGTEEVGVNADFKGASADGRRLFFKAIQPETEFNGLYMYEEGHSTLISGTEAEPGRAVDVEYAGSSADGSIVYFSGEGLTEESRPPGTLLYRYEPATRRLTATTPSPAGGENAAVRQWIATSRDGSYVYFLAEGVLAPGAQNVVSEEAENIYVLHEPVRGQRTIRYIGRTEAGTHGANIQGQLSPNGKHLVLSATSDLTGVEPAKECPNEGNSTGYCSQVYEYSPEEGALVCISCSATTAGSSTFGPMTSEYKINNQGPRSVLDDGTVFFNTTNALVPSDTNGVGDVYAWNGAGAQLISTGTSGSASVFSDATPDGHDIFFRTAQPLVGIDGDTRVDLYDARIGGGIAAQNPVAPATCEGSNCRGPSPTPTPLATGGSSGHAAVCATLGRSAEAAAKKVAALRRRARHAGGKQARVLHKKVRSAQRRAKRIHSRAGACRRAAR